MEHILQFGISIDDEMIKRNVEEKATEMVANDLKKEIIKQNYYGNSMGLSSETERIIRDVMEQYKDEIIEGAVQRVAESIKRSKKYKEVLAKITEEE